MRRFLISALILSLVLVVENVPATPTAIQFLSGTDKDHTVPWEFRVSAGRHSGVWTNIPVPSCWETMDFGTYEYGNIKTTEYGEYRKTFTVPSAWSGKRIFLVFEGSMTDTETKVNGQSAGGGTNLMTIHQGGFTEFKYDITTNVVFGANTNLLEVTVHKVSSNPSVNRAERIADYWVFGGIYRPVYLEAKPQASIERMAVDAKADGRIRVDTFLAGITTNYTVAAWVTDTNGLPFGREFSAAVVPGTSLATLDAILGAPQPWSAEFPTLYTLTVELRSGATLVHTITDQIGFRTITFSNNAGFFVNGRKVLLRGANRHEFWPMTGRTTSREVSIADIELMKNMNMNVARMSHYPPSKNFLEECDRLGLYVFDELTGWQKAYDTPTATRLIGEMVSRDVNHPCIIVWDNGDEGGSNREVDHDSATSTNVFALYDPQQRKIMRCMNWDEAFDGIKNWHYTSFTNFTKLLGAGKPVYLPTEILHGLFDGGGGASLAEYWDSMRKAPNGGGLILWALLDEGITNLQTGTIDVQKTAAPDGILGPFRQKEASYYTVKALWSPVQVTAPASSFSGSLSVENRFTFTDLNQCVFRWQLGAFPDPTATTADINAGFIVGPDSGNFAGPTVPAGMSGEIALPDFPKDWSNYDALRLIATDPFGREIYTWTWPLRSHVQIVNRIMGTAPVTPVITADITASEITLNNGSRAFCFSRTNGMITSLKVSSQNVSFANGPRPASGSWMVNSITNYFDGVNYVIRVNDLVNATNGFQWTLRPDGWLKLNYQFTLTGSQDNIGITFDYPAGRVTQMNWLGQGPYRVYKNRLAGQEIFVHTKAVNNTSTGQTLWNYPEFAGFHGQFYWATVLTTESPLTILTPTTNLFFRVLTPPNNGSAHVNPAYPAGEISLLHAIPPIGNKQQAAAVTGPAGQKNEATGLYTGEADFFFGVLESPAGQAGQNGRVKKINLAVVRP
jgi:Glycosyl hydrolases family 2, TIM barrel domain/Glycosyl hydrolases family 2, sugar binding domain/Glycosyl hydrolases family 2/Beta galactosidase small chain